MFPMNQETAVLGQHNHPNPIRSLPATWGGPCSRAPPSHLSAPSRYCPLEQQDPVQNPVPSLPGLCVSCSAARCRSWSGLDSHDLGTVGSLGSVSSRSVPPLGVSDALTSGCVSGRSVAEAPGAHHSPAGSLSH